MNEATSNAKPKHRISKNLNLMVQWAGKYIYLLIPVFIVLALETYLRTIVPLFGQHIIDVILGASDEPSRLPVILAQLIVSTSIGGQLLITSGLIIGTALIRSLFIFVRRLISGSFAEKTTYRLRNKLYKRCYK